MAACQSSPLCAPPRLLLLLLIGVISSHLLEVRGNPKDFWCKDQHRKTMEKRIEIEVKDVADTLPFPVQLPCIGLNREEWANKTLQQKREEVVGALQVFQEGVQGVKMNATLTSQLSVLGQLERHIKNILAIVKRLQIQIDTVAPLPSAGPHCSNQTSELSKVLKLYRKLLQGKLESLATDLHEKICKERGTTNTRGR